jgi:hypothetical protein
VRNREVRRTERAHADMPFPPTFHHISASFPLFDQLTCSVSFMQHVWSAYHTAIIFAYASATYRVGSKDTG